MSIIPRPLTPKQKALEINLDPDIYGTFAEIGAGQETVRYFYRAGGASGTLAKAMSAYDKDFSDSIYGKELDGRYVTEVRLQTMLDYEMNLIEERLDKSKRENRCFFTYANTVTTIDYAKKFKGHGWIGLRFQAEPNQAYNNIIFHVRFKENSAHLQQETLGIMGVNLIYGAFHYHDNPRKLLDSLYDSLDKDQIEIDMINFSGPRFEYVDNRLMSLHLLRNEMTQAVMFGPDGMNVLPAQLLYKKNIFALRGNFRPVTNLNIDMLNSGLKMFKKENEEINEDNLEVLFEITLSNLRQSGQIDERDFLNRADILCSLGHRVLISNFSEYYKLINYFSEFTKNQSKVGIAMGVNNLLAVFNEDYYTNLSGGIMEAFGRLFKRNVSVYLYPYLNIEEKVILDSNNLKVSDNLKELYKYFKLNDRIKDIEDYNPKNLTIYSRKVLKAIAANDEGWESQLPEGIPEIIKKQGMFGCEVKYAKQD